MCKIKLNVSCIFLSIVMCLSFSSCSKVKLKESETKGKIEEIIKSANSVLESYSNSRAKLINEDGVTLEQRFKVPEGFERVSVEKGSFGEFLRTIKLKPHGSKVLYFDGREKDKPGVYEAVIDIPIGNRDLHQCADAVMLLRGQYLYDNKKYSDIHFNFVNGFKAKYSKWMEGYRIIIKGNSAAWIKSNAPSNNQQEFRKFMDVVFTYASTLSLEKELKPVNKSEMQLGDVFIKGGSPGHAIIVMDMAENKETKEKLFMLAQSYMPAQETQILCNPESKSLSPWYSLNYSGDLNTPEWTFSENMLKRFEN